MPFVSGVLGIIPKGFSSGDHPDYDIIKIGQNTKKNPEDVRRLAVTWTPVKNHQLILM